MFIRTPYNYDRAATSRDTGLSCPEPTLAQQQFKLDSDPNTIMRQFVRTNDATLLNVTTPNYGDFTGISDYQSALNAVIRADSQFMALPSSIRSRFHNDPSELLDFISDSANRDEAIKLGLLREGLSTPGADGAPTELKAAPGVGNPAGDAVASSKASPKPSKKVVPKEDDD